MISFWLCDIVGLPLPYVDRLIFYARNDSLKKLRNPVFIVTLVDIYIHLEVKPPKEANSPSGNSRNLWNLMVRYRVYIDPSTGPYPQLDDSNQHHLMLFLQDPLNVTFASIPRSPQYSLSIRISYQIFVEHRI
jgi:hypothetical protein